MDYPDRFDEPGYCVLEEKFFDKSTTEISVSLVDYTRWNLSCIAYGIKPPAQLRYGFTILFGLAMDRLKWGGIQRLVAVHLGEGFDSAYEMKNTIAP